MALLGISNYRCASGLCGVPVGRKVDFALKAHQDKSMLVYSGQLNSKSEIAHYEFTTLTAIPGVLEYDGAEIQVLDLPGIIEGASQGKGRGRQVVSVAKTSDLILMVLDASKSSNQRQALEHELEEVGIRLNKEPPNISFKVKTTGGIKFNSTVKLTHLDQKMVYSILHDYSKSQASRLPSLTTAEIHNADVLIKEDCTVDDFIDVLIGTRQYIKCLYVYNKIDSVSLEEVDRLAHMPHSVVISCEMDLNLDYLKARIWSDLGLLRIYTKRKGELPDFSEALIVKDHSTIENVVRLCSRSARLIWQCNSIHRTLVEQFRYGMVWGQSAKFSPQKGKSFWRSGLITSGSSPRCRRRRCCVYLH